MRWISILLLVVLSVTITTPFATLSFVPDEQGDAVLAGLDVCHSAAPALSSGGEMPCAVTCPCGLVPFAPVALLTPAPPSFTELLLTDRNEQPPQS